ncbi:unnamed protein product [Zymoseptoria tritici ST99CH_1E4]|uniref:Uncharacterized protein n=1 Tax=Zymoseptoria tritici ST99CH_1E4 TaxID=1276532 RepID=A0A2H1H9J1_ZYMTR|nr:unnamed protein product [Zymoseptoria tritici ST99CH_1E4]
MAENNEADRCSAGCEVGEDFLSDSHGEEALFFDSHDEETLLFDPHREEALLFDPHGREALFHACHVGDSDFDDPVFEAAERRRLQDSWATQEEAQDDVEQDLIRLKSGVKNGTELVGLSAFPRTGIRIRIPHILFALGAIVLLCSGVALVFIDRKRLLVESSALEPCQLSPLPIAPQVPPVDLIRITSNVSTSPMARIRGFDSIWAGVERATQQCETSVAGFNRSIAASTERWNCALHEAAAADALARSQERVFDRLLRDLAWAGMSWLRPRWAGGRATMALEGATAEFHRLYPYRMREVGWRFDELAQVLDVLAEVVRALQQGGLEFAGRAAWEEEDERLVGELEQVLRRVVASLEHAVKQARRDGEKWREAAEMVGERNTAVLEEDRCGWI